MSKKEKLFFGIVISYIAIVAVPIFNFVISLPMGVINFVVFISALLLFPNAFKHSVVIWLTVYVVVLVLFAMVGSLPDLGIGSVAAGKRILIEMAYILPIVSILCVGNYIKNNNFYIKIGLYATILMVVSFLYTSFLLISDASIIRANAAEGLSDYGQFNPLLPNYTLMHAYVFLTPGILYLIKYNQGYRKILFLGYLILTLYVIINTQITTAMILVVFFIIFSFVWEPNKTSNSILKMTLAVVLVLVLNQMGVFETMANSLVSFFEGTAAETKMEDFQTLLEGGDTSSSNLSGRENRHLQSLMAFFDNVLIGNSSKLGGHSFLLDRLGGMGLVGFIPFAFLLINMIKMASKIVVDSEQKAFFVMGTIGVFIMIYEKGLFGQEGYLLSLIVFPCMMMLRYYVKSAKTR